jgi:hypothetical protein
MACSCMPTMDSSTPMARKAESNDAAGGFEQGNRVGVLLGLYDGSLPFLKNGAPHGSGYAARSAQRRSPSRSSSADVQSASKAAAAAPAPACVSCQTHSSRAVKPARRAVGTTPSPELIAYSRYQPSPIPQRAAGGCRCVGVALCAIALSFELSPRTSSFELYPLSTIHNPKSIISPNYTDLRPPNRAP